MSCIPLFHFHRTLGRHGSFSNFVPRTFVEWFVVRKNLKRVVMHRNECNCFPWIQLVP